MKEYNKLVRDRIPEIIRNSGGTPICETLTETACLSALDAKLQEEVQEYLAAPCAEEIADILEVLDALCAARGIPKDDLLRIKENKRRERGGFEQRIFLRRVLDASD